MLFERGEQAAELTEQGETMWAQTEIGSCLGGEGTHATVHSCTIV